MRTPVLLDRMTGPLTRSSSQVASSRQIASARTLLGSKHVAYYVESYSGFVHLPDDGTAMEVCGQCTNDVSMLKPSKGFGDRNPLENTSIIDMT